MMSQSDQPDQKEISRAPPPGGRARRILSSLPILGPLAHCTAKNHKDSLKEFFITLIFGTATFWVTAVFLKAFVSNREKNYFELLASTISNGQLFIFAVGMLGPILLASAEDSDSTKQFPGRAYHFAAMLFLGALSSGFYAFVLAGREPVVKELLDSDFLLIASIFIAGIVVTLRYLTTVYRKSTLAFDAERGLKQPVNDFADKFAARHPNEESLDAAPYENPGADKMTEHFNRRNGGQA
ncbi:hypothetical protein ACF8O9_06505 [Stenotrophomonas geniculata]|uniref:hypothetical protein n=1 Tax=Stenotrophomonas geniculata TaxID=86188 RepID=UPI00370CBCC8